jgi:hypothetical protein
MFPRFFCLLYHYYSLKLFNMESTFNIPVPKQPKKELTRDQRLRVQTLFLNAQLKRAQICLITGYKYDHVCPQFLIV